MRSELPPDISKETLKEMGIMQLADSKVWTYKNNGDSYVLTAKLSSKTYTSPYSNKSLPDVIRYPEGYQDNRLGAGMENTILLIYSSNIITAF